MRGDGAVGDAMEDTPGRVLCRVGHWQLLGEGVGEQRRTWQLGEGRHDAERGDATAATFRDVQTSGRCVETRQKPWAQGRREAWAVRRLQALEKGTRRTQERGRGSEMRRGVARRVQRVASFLAKTLPAWQSALNRKSAKDGVRQWQRQVAMKKQELGEVGQGKVDAASQSASSARGASVLREEWSDNILDAVRQWHANVSRAGSKSGVGWVRRQVSAAIVQGLRDEVSALEGELTSAQEAEQKMQQRSESAEATAGFAAEQASTSLQGLAAGMAAHRRAAEALGNQTQEMAAWVQAGGYGSASVLGEELSAAWQLIDKGHALAAEFSRVQEAAQKMQQASEASDAEAGAAVKQASAARMELAASRDVARRAEVALTMKKQELGAAGQGKIDAASRSVSSARGALGTAEARVVASVAQASWSREELNGEVRALSSQPAEAKNLTRVERREARARERELTDLRDKVSTLDGALGVAEARAAESNAVASVLREELSDRVTSVKKVSALWGLAWQGRTWSNVSEVHRVLVVWFGNAMRAKGGGYHRRLQAKAATLPWRRKDPRCKE